MTLTILGQFLHVQNNHHQTAATPLDAQKQAFNDCRCLTVLITGLKPNLVRPACLLALIAQSNVTNNDD